MHEKGLKIPRESARKPPRKGFREYIVDQVKTITKETMLSEITPDEAIKAIESMTPSAKKKVLLHFMPSLCPKGDLWLKMCQYKNCLTIDQTDSFGLHKCSACSRMVCNAHYEYECIEEITLCKHCFYHEHP